MKAAIIPVNTLEYKASKENSCGSALKRMAEQVGFQVKFMKVLPEDEEVLAKIMSVIADEGVADLILTAGSIGFTKDDCIPEATRKIIDKELPGIPEAMRIFGMRHGKRVILTRAVAGIRKNTLIVNLPGNAKNVKESLEYVLPEIVHTVEVLTGENSHSEK